MYENLWKKRILVPLWVIQVLFSAIVLALSSFGLGVYEENKDETDYDSSDDGATYDQAIKAGAAVYISFSVVTILFNIVEIVLYARKRLSPVLAVVFNSITALAWLVILILNIVALATVGVSPLGFFFYLVIVATCKGKLLYAGIVLHRYRRSVRARGAYTPAIAGAGAFDASHTAYNPAGPPPNPFRDPSRDPSPAPPQNPLAGNAGASYYATSGYNAAPFQYEMQQQPQQSGERYA